MSGTIKNLQLVPKVIFGRGSVAQLDDILKEPRAASSRPMVFLVDDVFRDRDLVDKISRRDDDRLIWVNVDEEPKTTGIDRLRDDIREEVGGLPAGIVGIGGGSVMDIAKAVALMLTNPGSSADYQGWDLVREPGVFHAGIPTLAGTGAEVSRTAVLTGPVRKLGLNSDHTVFDQVILDPDLVDDAPNPQRFYTGMDCYIHCVESTEGTFRNAFSDAYAEKGMALCREVFLGDEQPDSNDKLVMASFFGGMSIAYSQVGVAHALSYGLSYVLGVRHGVGNCIVFDQLEDYYPDGVAEFRRMLEHGRIELPRGVTKDLSDEGMNQMIDVAMTLDPLWQNALGPDWKAKMPRSRMEELYSRM